MQQEPDWVGFNTFRHTFTSNLFRSGRNVVVVQRWLVHHAPSFTLYAYVHMLPSELECADHLDAMISGKDEKQSAEHRNECYVGGCCNLTDTPTLYQGAKG